MNQATLNPTTTLPFSQFRINLLDHDVVKAMVSCKVGDAIYLTGMRVMHGKNGRFVSMPARQDKKGEYHDIFFPTSKEVRDRLMEAVLENYDTELAKKG